MDFLTKVSFTKVFRGFNYNDAMYKSVNLEENKDEGVIVGKVLKYEGQYKYGYKSNSFWEMEHNEQGSLDNRKGHWFYKVYISMNFFELVPVDNAVEIN